MGNVIPNRRRYLISLAEELNVQANRVRDLIGDRHWLSDGHHKEYLLLDLLRRHLPVGLLASRGFVISPSNSETRSTEQDILIVETLYEAPIFHQGGLIVAFPAMVKAAISVKTTLDSRSVKESVEGLCTVRDVASGLIDARSLWCGAFYFTIDKAVEKEPMLIYNYVRRSIAVSPVAPALLAAAHPPPAGPDLYCSAKELIVKLDHGYQSDEKTTIPPRLLGYRSKGFATAAFLGDLLDHLGTSRGLPEADFLRFAEVGDCELLGEPQSLVQATDQ